MAAASEVPPSISPSTFPTTFGPSSKPSINPTFKKSIETAFEQFILQIKAQKPVAKIYDDALLICTRCEISPYIFYDLSEKRATKPAPPVKNEWFCPIEEVD